MYPARINLPNLHEHECEIDRLSGDSIKTGRRLAQMADIYTAQGESAHAETFYKRAIEFLRAAGEKKSLAISLKQLGQLYTKAKRYDLALKTLKECEEICRSTQNRYTLQQTCRLLAEVLARRAPEQAVAYMKEAFLLNDSIHSERAEQMSQEIRRNQNCALCNEGSNKAAPLSCPTRLQFVYLALAAAIGILFGLWFSRLRRQRAEAREDLLYRLPDTEADHPSAITLPEKNEITQSTEREPDKPSVPSASDKDLEFLTKVSELYISNLEMRRLSIDDLASEMCMSRSQFTRRITAITGSNANNFFNRIRMEKATRLLKSTEKSISTIAYECGFEDVPYFCNTFKKFYKVTPMQYRIIPKS